MERAQSVRADVAGKGGDAFLEEVGLKVGRMMRRV